MHVLNAVVYCKYMIYIVIYISLQNIKIVKYRNIQIC